MATAHSTHWPSEVQPATMTENYFESRCGFSSFNKQQHQLLQFQNQTNDAGMIIREGNNMMNNRMMRKDTGLTTGLSTGATSLLCGPIMATKSDREELKNSRATSNNRADTIVTMECDIPSKARKEFLSSQKPMLVNTPSVAMEESILSTQKPPSMMAVNRMIMTTPSATYAEFLSSLQKMPPCL